MNVLDTTRRKAGRTPASCSIIAGRRIEEPVSRRYLAVNPSDTREVISEVLEGGVGTFVAACRTARAVQTEWASVPAPVRGRAIQQIGRLVESNKQALARLVTVETGKPYAEALGEIQEVIDTCTFFLGEGRRLYGQTMPSEMASKQLFTYRTPVGVCAVVTAGNLPVAVPSWYIIPALVCGNTVVWKPAGDAATSAGALTEIFLHGGLPEGVLNLVITDGPTTLTGLERGLEGRVIDKVAFTGSSEVGQRIGELCGRYLQSPCLQLGGKNPLVVMDDADLDLAVEGAVFSGFATAGQRCTSLGTVIVSEKVHGEFLRRYAEAVSSAVVGDPMQPVLFGPMMNERFLRRFEDEWLGLIQEHHSLWGSTGAGRITRANPRDGFLGDPERGLYVHPTIVAGVRSEDELANTETVGPLVSVAKFSEWDEAMALANGHGYGLTAAVYTNAPSNVFRFREQVTAGMVNVNSAPSGPETHLPVGGNGRSGNGAGSWALDQFTRWQSVNWDYSGRLQKAQMDVVDVPADLDFRLDDI